MRGTDDGDEAEAGVGELEEREQSMRAHRHRQTGVWVGTRTANKSLRHSDFCSPCLRPPFIRAPAPGRAPDPLPARARVPAPPGRQAARGALGLPGVNYVGARGREGGRMAAVPEPVGPARACEALA